MLGQFAVRDGEFHVFGEAVADGVIDVVIALLVAVEKWRNDGDENDEKKWKDFDDAACDFVEFGEERAMVELFQNFIKGKNESGEDSDGTDDAEEDAFGHDEAEIKAERESHETEGDEAGDGSGGGAKDRGESGFDGLLHGLIFVFGLFEIFAETVPEENGIIHGNGELQDGGKGFGDVGNFAKDKVSAEVDDNHDADTCEEEERGEPVVEEGKHDGECEQNSDNDVNRLFLFGEISEVGDESGHAGNIKVAVHDATDFVDGVDGLIGRGGSVKEDGD